MIHSPFEIYQSYFKNGYSQFEIGQSLFELEKINLYKKT